MNSIRLIFAWLAVCCGAAGAQFQTSIEQISQDFSKPLLTLRVAPNGEHLFAGNESGFRIYDPQTLKETWPLTEAAGWITSAAFSADSRYLVTVGHKKTLTFWDLGNHKKIASSDNNRWMWETAAHDKKRECISSGGFPGIDRWDLQTGKNLRSVTTEHDRITGLCVIPETNAFVCAGQIGKKGKDRHAIIEVRDFDTLAVRRRLGILPDQVDRFAVSLKCDRLVAMNKVGETIVWSLPTFEKLAEFKVDQTYVRDIRFAQDGRHIFAAGWGRKLQVVDITSGNAQYLSVPKSRGATSCDVRGTRIYIGHGTTGAIGACDYKSATASSEVNVPHTSVSDSPARSSIKSEDFATRHKAEIDRKRADIIEVLQSVRKLSDLHAAAQAEPDDVSRFLAFEQLADRSFALGDHVMAQKAVARLQQQFGVDRLLFAGSRIYKMDSSRWTSQHKQAWATWAEALGDDAQSQEEVQMGIALYDRAAGWASSARDKNLLARVNTKRTNLRKAEKPWLEARQARALLAADPSEPVACETWGSYLCFVRGKWKSGMPLLAKCDAADLREIAKMEDAYDGSDQSAVELAQRWSFAATSRSDHPTSKAGCIEAARYWFRKAVAKQKGLRALKTQSIIDSMESTSAPPRS